MMLVKKISPYVNNQPLAKRQDSDVPTVLGEHEEMGLKRRHIEKVCVCGEHAPFT